MGAFLDDSEKPIKGLPARCQSESVGERALLTWYRMVTPVLPMHIRARASSVVVKTEWGGREHVQPLF